MIKKIELCGSMQFICEIVPSSFLTPLRRALAQKLVDLGFVQIEIAQIIGISQPVVSSYLKTPLADTSPITSRSAFDKLVSNLASRIKNGTASSLDLMEIICQECQQFRAAGPLCDIHRKKTTLDFPADCDICFPSTELSEVFNQKLQVTKELFDAAQQLINTEETFGQLIPEIGCQFICMVGDGKTSADIAGFPGRIVKVKGKGKIISSPEFGQGSTLAQILLYFQKHGSKKRSLISIRNTEDILKIIKPEKVLVMTEEADKNWDETLRRFPDTEIAQIEVIADGGGVGLEPIIYLFGRNPSEISEFLASIF